jgi:hypothetical protein
MDITSAHTSARQPEDIARRLYQALDALMEELGGPATWDADVEAMFRRQTLERALLALDEADTQGLGSNATADIPPRFLRSV